MPNAIKLLLIVVASLLVGAGIGAVIPCHTCHSYFLKDHGKSPAFMTTPRLSRTYTRITSPPTPGKWLSHGGWTMAAAMTNHLAYLFVMLHTGYTTRGNL